MSMKRIVIGTENEAMLKFTIRQKHLQLESGKEIKKEGVRRKG